jgi:hypothetical protein
MHRLSPLTLRVPCSAFCTHQKLAGRADELLRGVERDQVSATVEEPHVKLGIATPE